MNDNSDWPWAGMIAGAALAINSDLNDRDAAQGRTPSWVRRHPIVYVSAMWVALLIFFIVAAFVLYWYAMAGAALAHFFPGHDLVIGFLQIGAPIYFIGKWRYLLAEKRWNPNNWRR